MCASHISEVNNTDTDAMLMVARKILTISSSSTLRRAEESGLEGLSSIAGEVRGIVAVLLRDDVDDIEPASR